MHAQIKTSCLGDDGTLHTCICRHSEQVKPGSQYDTLVPVYRCEHWGDAAGIARLDFYSSVA